MSSLKVKNIEQESIQDIYAEIDDVRLATDENIKHVLKINEESNDKLTSQLQALENTTSATAKQLECKLIESTQLLREEVEKKFAEHISNNEKQYYDMITQLNSLSSKIKSTDKMIGEQFFQITEQLEAERKRLNIKFYFVVGAIFLVALADILLNMIVR